MDVVEIPGPVHENHGGAVGLGAVENKEGVTIDFVNSGSYEIEIASQLYPAKASLRPLYDPQNKRVRS